MEFNRLVSLVIGFIVLILLFVWIASRFRASSNTASKPTPTITMTVTPTPSGEKKGWNPLGFLFKGKTPTPTPSEDITESKTTVKQITSTPVVAVTTQSSQVEVGENQQVSSETVVYRNNRNGNTISYTVEGVRQIPQTGLPTLVLPLALSALSFGAYLKKRS